MKTIYSGFRCLVVMSATMLLTTKIVLAQDIQTIPAEPAVKSGVLPNGMSWYVAENHSLKGSADFALVQLTGASTVPDADRERIVSLSQEALSVQPRLKSQTAQDFFVGHGVLPGKDGFVKVEENSTVFRFNGVDLTQSQYVLDSTLVVLMGVAERYFRSDDSLVRRWYVPADQAIVVAGDVDAAKVEEKMRMLSYMMPFSESAPRREYVWRDSDDMKVSIAPSSDPGLSTVSVSWRMPRTPREYMNTVHPVIMERYMTELGFVAQDRIRRKLLAEDIPVALTDSRYEGSAGTLGDEEFSVSLSVKTGDLSRAVAVLAETMGSLDAGTAGIEEVKKATMRYVDSLSDHVPSNSDYVDRCVSAFIYNSPLASRKHINSFHLSKALSDSTMVSLFNSIAMASLDRSRNLSIDVLTCDRSIGVEDIEENFLTSWGGGTESPSHIQNDTLRLCGPSEKIKVRSVRKEPMSGGSLWKLSNGMKVIVKKLPSDGKVYYSLSLNGGYGNIRDLKRGEGAYMSDFLKVCRFSGVDAETFARALRNHGMTLDFKVGFSTFSVEGSVPEDALDYMLRALRSVLNERSPDSRLMSYYLESEHLGRHMRESGVTVPVAVMDSIMYPGYRYTSCFAERMPDKSFLDRADSFLKSRSSQVNDGVLVLVGDVDEKLLKKALETYAGGFVTSNKAFSRPVVSFQPISGTVMRMEDGEENHVDIALSAPVAITADNVYAVEIAAIALKKELARALAGKGMYADLRHEFRKDPHERLGLFVSLHEASVEGFVPGTAHDDPVAALHTALKVLNEMGTIEIADSELVLYKNRLKQKMDRMMDTPQYWRKAIARRYLDGKDFTTDHKSRIDSVTKDDIRDLLGQLAGGSRVEYIIREK